MVKSRKNRNTRKNRTMYGGASKRLLCDCQEVGAGGRRFSAGNAAVNMAALTIPAFKGKAAGKTKRVATGKAKAWQNLVKHAFANLRKNNPAATFANATRRAKEMRNTDTVPADLAAAAIAAAANAGVAAGNGGNATTRKAQRNIERAERAAADAAAKAAKAQAASNAKAAKAASAANSKAAKEQEKLARAAAAANAKAAREQEKAAAKATKEAAAREKAEATAAAAAARLAALQAKLGLGTRQ